MIQKKTVYLSVNNSTLHIIEEGRLLDTVEEQEAFVFTPEQLNEYTQSVINKIGKSITDKMFDTYHTVCEDKTIKGVFSTQKEALDLANKLNNETNLYHDWCQVTRLNGGYTRHSILNILEEINLKFKV